MEDQLYSADKVFIHETVEHSEVISVISVIVGWTYVVAWSISFYPQVYENFVRKSVVGLSFDYVALNIVGYGMYTMFNIGLYWIPEIREEYFQRHPGGLIPVKLNDIVFGANAEIATLITALQCFYYERGNQRISNTTRSILIAYFLFSITCLGLALFNFIEWLDLLNDCSYIKLSVTLIKYIPPALMNYRRKSTVGWSIGFVLLDFTGSALSMAEMILNAYNHDDWVSLIGNATKFGLGLVSIIFDILFMVQHYVLYRHSSEEIDLPLKV